MVLPPDDAWASYARMVIEIARGPVVVRAAPLGQVGRWPWPSGEPVHILTAWNPGTSRPGAVANRSAQARLEEDLRPLATSMWGARGVDPATGERDEGVAVRGPDEQIVRALAGRYGQDAIFSWSPLEWAIVSCLGARREVAGWALG
jgi:Protein of unknown function (DUF3293)